MRIALWRFRPAVKDGEPVKVQANVQVNFRLIGRSFDSKAESQRTRFNAIVARLSRQKEGGPSDQDLKTMQDLAKHKFPAAEYAIGVWEINGDVLPKDVSAGLANIQKAADKDYGPALFLIGRCDMEGKLLPKDLAKGLSLIQDAAVLGSTQAQFMFGANVRDR